MKNNYPLFSLISLLFCSRGFTQTTCFNSDFESSSTGIVTSISSLTGWTIESGINSGAGSSCSLNTFTGIPNAVSVFGTTTGFIDPNIGPSYPIYSVFGSTPNAGGMFGDRIIRVNDATPNFGAHRITKGMSVTPANNLFTIAFINISVGAHTCCDGAMARFQFKDASNNILSCPKILDNYPVAGCSGVASYSLCPMNASMSYHKWMIVSFDLTPYIGSVVFFEGIVVDCNAGSHPGYMYFDAECGPTTLIMCGNIFPMSTGTVNLPTCGAGSTATITAPNGLGPYQWTGPAGFVPTTGQTCTTTIAGGYTLTMTPPGACSPIIQQMNVVMTPSASITAASSTSILCSGNTAVLTATGVSTYTWSTSSTSNSIAVTPTINTAYTVNGTDMYGCTASAILTQNVSSCTGIESMANPNGLLLYPNPNTGEFTITIENIDKAELVIENALGQLMFTQTITRGENKIRTKNLSSGIYYYSVKENGKIIVKSKLQIE